MVVTAAVKLATKGGAVGAAAKTGSEKSLDKIGGFLDTILKTIKPILDIIGFILAVTLQFVVKVIKGLANLEDKFIAFREKIKEKLVELKDKLKEKLVELKDKFVEKIIELKDRFIEWIKALPGRIWDFIKTGFSLLKDKFIELKDKFVEKIIELKERLLKRLQVLKFELKEKLTTLKDKLKDKLIELKDKIVEKFIELRDKLGTWFTDLPGKIWEKVQALAGLIADKIREFFGIPTKVSDAIITKDGKIIQTDPADTIIATKTPGNIGGSKTFIFNGLTWPEAMEQVKRELGVDSFGQGRF